VQRTGRRQPSGLSEHLFDYGRDDLSAEFANDFEEFGTGEPQLLGEHGS
jgi:hypothetical protein